MKLKFVYEFRLFFFNSTYVRFFKLDFLCHNHKETLSYIQI